MKNLRYNRKKLITFVALLLCLNATAQKATVRSFSAMHDSINALLNTKSSTDDPEALLEGYELLANEYDKLPKSARDSIYAGTAAGIYYNAACGAALTGKKKKALRFLAKAVNKGWNQTSYTREDTDLSSLHGNNEFERLIAIMEEKSYLGVLKRAAEYTDEPNDIISFTYAAPNDSNLVRTRRYFNLDSIAGSGDEVSKIKNLMYFVHEAVTHDGSSYNPKKRDAISLYEICKKENRGINCRMMAIMLNELYLSMGWKSRYVTCFPADSTDVDCHVINAVFCNTLDKWVWMDPTFAAYVSDENGVLLGIDEVRERLVTGRPIVLNEDANWNHKSHQTKSHYIDEYMAKNLYVVECCSEYRYGNESTFKPEYFALAAKGHEANWITRDRKNYSTTNNKLFWQPPY